MRYVRIDAREFNKSWDSESSMSWEKLEKEIADDWYVYGHTGIPEIIIAVLKKFKENNYPLNQYVLNHLINLERGDVIKSLPEKMSVLFDDPSNSLEISPKLKFIPKPVAIKLYATDNICYDLDVRLTKLYENLHARGKRTYYSTIGGEADIPSTEIISRRYLRASRLILDLNNKIKIALVEYQNHMINANGGIKEEKAAGKLFAETVINLFEPALKDKKITQHAHLLSRLLEVFKSFCNKNFGTQFENKKTNRHEKLLSIFTSLNETIDPPKDDPISAYDSTKPNNS